MANSIDLSQATSLEQQAFLCALALQAAELALPEEDRPDQTQIDYDSEGQTAAISINLNTNTVVDNGSAVISISPYLT